MKNVLHASVFALTLLASPALFAQNAPSPGASSDTSLSAGGNAAGDGPRAEKWKAVFGQLDLTDAQKAQIKQIRTTTSPGAERRQQIMAVLTPAQKEKLVAMFRACRADQAAP